MEHIRHTDIQTQAYIYLYTCSKVQKYRHRQIFINILIYKDVYRQRHISLHIWIQKKTHTHKENKDTENDYRQKLTPNRQRTDPHRTDAEQTHNRHRTDTEKRHNKHRIDTEQRHNRHRTKTYKTQNRDITDTEQTHKTDIRKYIIGTAQIQTDRQKRKKTETRLGLLKNEYMGTRKVMKQ